jgi:heat shock protein HtpX
VTDGLIRQLGLRELIGVLAHEVSHVRSNDLWVMGLADMFSRATSILSLLGQMLLLINLPLLLFSAATMINWWVILLLIFAPTLASLAQLALSRTREHHADLNAVQLTGDPDGLASALVRIEQTQGGWLERIFLPGRGVPAPSVLRTHPETSERVERLMALKSTLGAVQGPFDDGAPRVTGFGPSIARPPRWHISGLWH